MERGYHLLNRSVWLFQSQGYVGNLLLTAWSPILWSQPLNDSRELYEEMGYCKWEERKQDMIVF